MYKVRNYKAEDYQMVKGWWDASKEAAPGPELLPLDSTLVLEIDGVPSVCVALFLTNSKEMCLMEGFISKPDLPKAIRNDAVQTMFDSACLFAKKLGYKKVITLAYVDKIKTRCVELGFTKTLDNLSSFVVGL